MTEKTDGPDWDELQTLWQEDSSVDFAQLARHIRFVWWRMRVVFLVELLLCLGGLGVMVHFIVEQPVFERYLFGGTMSLYCCFGLWAAFWVRKGSWGASDETPHSLIELQMRRVRSALKYIKVNNWSAALSVPLLGIGVWAALNSTPPPGPERLDDLILFCSVYGAGLVIYALTIGRYRKKKTLELATLEQAAAALDQSLS